MPKRLNLNVIDASTPAEEFFTQYVSKRQPVIIGGLPDDTSFKGTKWTDLGYLSEKAGGVEVMVEPMHPTARQYGTDVERVSMPFREFLDSLQNASGPHHYLTTQYADDEPDTTTVFPPPTNALRDDFPVVPRIMGNLFLQQVNLWLGKSKDGSSSGLHHDFHDNLYCLLEGRKRFVLFPPSEVKNLYPYGTLDTLFPNGLISYDDVPVRSDGLTKRAACKARIGALERQIDALKGRMKGKGKAKTQNKEMKALVEAHDAALDELAMLALDDEQGEEEVDDFDQLMAGLEDIDGEGGAGPSGTGNGRADGEDEEEEWNGFSNDDEGSAGPSADSDDDDEGDAEQGDAETPAEPSSFSRIPTAHLHQYLDLPTTATLPSDFSPAQFPSLAKTVAPYVIELSAGQMLYLPASWWHEVTSTSGQGMGSAVHMAFNYWFYPPDAPESFEKPYQDALVWEYLRSRETTGRDRTPTERLGVGKRSQAGAEGAVSKKARR